MKYCFSCKKEIADNAEFCPHCGSIMASEKKAKGKWFFRSSSLVVSFMCVGPFMLPLLWMKPGLSITAKVIYTAVILVLSYLIFVVFLRSLSSILDSYQFAASSM